MQILGIDTSTTHVSVALSVGGDIRASVSIESGRRHAEHLAPVIRTVTDMCGVPLAQVSAIGVGVGPGLFTGLRVGVTTATVLAQTLRVAVVGIPSLDLLAFPVRTSPRLIAAVIDARRREVFWGLYRSAPGGLQRVSEYCVGAPSELVNDLRARGDDVLFVGDGTRPHRTVFEELDGVEFAGSEFAVPSASALVTLAGGRMEREEFSAPEHITPLYLRESDAEVPG